MKLIIWIKHKILNQSTNTIIPYNISYPKNLNCKIYNYPFQKFQNPNLNYINKNYYIQMKI